MANVNLASLTFPGLSDTYIIPKEIAYINTLTGSNADIEAALAADKLPVAVVNPLNLGDPVQRCVYWGKTSTTAHYFGGVNRFGETITVECFNGTWSVTSRKIPSWSTATPQPLGQVPSSGSSNSFSKDDHVHQMPSAADVGAIPAPASASIGDFLCYTANGWAATTVPSANGVSF